MDVQRKQQLMAVYRDGLLEDTLPFWIPRAVDRECGGFTIARDRDGTLLDTDKGMWQQCRFTWLLGELYNTVEPRQEWLDLCCHGVEFINRYGYDHNDRRMWFHLTRDGQPIRKRRYAFTESFAAIAFGEYARAARHELAAREARVLFGRFVEHHRNPQYVEPKFTDTRPMKGIGVPMITIGMAQQLRDSVDLEDADQWIDHSIDEIQRDFVKPDIQCVMESVGPGGEIYDHFDGRLLNPGHAIEAAWFIMKEGKIRNDSQLIQLGCTILDWMWHRGWDTEHGGILYFRDVYHKPVQEYWQDMKFWWPHNEAIIATLLAYQLTGDEKYASWHQQVHDWSYAHFPDPEYGEWYGYLHRDGRVSVPLKGNLWKGPFHLPRMQLECWRILEEML